MPRGWVGIDPSSGQGYRNDFSLRADSRFYLGGSDPRAPSIPSLVSEAHLRPVPFLISPLRFRQAMWLSICPHFDVSQSLVRVSDLSVGKFPR